MSNYGPPAKHAHGLGWWLLIGWWLAPAQWTGRVLLWLLFFPLGIWRSVAHSRSKREARERRGWQQT